MHYFNLTSYSIYEYNIIVSVLNMYKLCSEQQTEMFCCGRSLQCAHLECECHCLVSHYLPLVFCFRDGRDDQAYCEDDFNKLHGIRCELCAEFIAGKVVQVGNFVRHISLSYWFEGCVTR